MKESRLIIFGIVIAFLVAIGIIGATAIYYSPSESQQGNTQIIIYQNKDTNRQQTQQTQNQDQRIYQSYQNGQQSQQGQQYQTQQNQQSRSYTTSESQYLSGQRYSYSYYRPYYYPRYYRRYYLAYPYSYYPYFPRYPYFNQPPHYYWNLY